VLWDLVKSSYEELGSTYEVMVIEGPGSAAAMNLRDRDLVN
jgi:cobyric acid synthase